MSLLRGREAAVNKGANVVAEMGSWSLDMSADAIEAMSFGDDWKRNEVGFLGWSATIEGYYDPADTDGQASLQTAFLAKTLVADIRFYLDDTSYWVPDLTNDSSAGSYITAFTPGAEKAGLVAISITFAGSGPITLV